MEITLKKEVRKLSRQFSFLSFKTKKWLSWYSKTMLTNREREFKVSLKLLNNFQPNLPLLSAVLTHE